jgi:hypothetical protein
MLGASVRLRVLLAAFACAACAGRDRTGTMSGDAGGSTRDAGALRDADGVSRDGAVLPHDSALPLRDGAVRDAPALDAGFADSGAPDAGSVMMIDAGRPGGGCISGATGTHVVRFRWEGTVSGERATVDYEENTLPDTTRWRVSAAAMSFDYVPTFADPFLGEGGLDLEGTAFIDVELSTGGLAAVESATLAIYGRSFDTTSSGSFSWQSFADTGETPSGFVSNVAPYRWYLADATTALPAGDDGTLLRIRAGPPSDALIVNRVEICFDAR